MVVRMSDIDSSDLEIRDGRVSQVGIADRTKGTILKRTDDAIVVKWPGTTSRTTYGNTRYTPVRTCVYLIDDTVTYESGQTERLTVRFLIDFSPPPRRK